tara:strand:+ start:4484 stop:4627 length:144 start_codon:yes stop_codon:yes gene_type:complete
VRDKKRHNEFLINQYNRNRSFKEQVKDIYELNRKRLDEEIKALGNKK